MARTSITSEEPRAGCSKRLPSKAAASEEARRTLRYVELLSDARTPLVGFFSILLEDREVVLLQMQLLIRHDNDFRGTLALHGLQTLALFILQQPDD